MSISTTSGTPSSGTPSGASSSGPPSSGSPSSGPSGASTIAEWEARPVSSLPERSRSGSGWFSGWLGRRSLDGQHGDGQPQDGQQGDGPQRGARAAGPPVGRRVVLAAVVLAVVWSLWDAGVGRTGVINGGGWSNAGEFVTSAWRPELSGDFLAIVWRAALTTVGYALVGTAVALVIGITFGVATSETVWRRDPLSRRGAGRPRRWWSLVRLAVAVPRGVHEAVWALALLLVLGPDPLVAVLAIGVPFGFITAKVVAEAIDDAAAGPYESLRAAGSSRLAALAYGVAPTIVGDVVSYGFYRLECSVRSSVVLGMIGVGGLGFEIAVSEDGLRYGELWTLIYALVIISAAADGWGASLRRGVGGLRWRRASVVLATVGTLGSAWWLGVGPGAFFDSDTRQFASRLADDAWPPVLPRGGWSELFEAMIDTLQLSIIAMAIAIAGAAVLGFVAARPRRTGTSDERRLLRRGTGLIARWFLLLIRTIPAPLWALLVLFVVFPGPLPGGIALGLYTLGVLGRLSAEVIENADARPAHVLRTQGAPSTSAFVFGTVPVIAPRFVALSAYRWEVTIRETVIVGLVGAGGLGQLLREQRAGFDEARMFTTVIALIVLAWVVDLVSARLRRVLR